LNIQTLRRSAALGELRGEAQTERGSASRKQRGGARHRLRHHFGIRSATLEGDGSGTSRSGWRIILQKLDIYGHELRTDCSKLTL